MKKRLLPIRLHGRFYNYPHERINRNIFRSLWLLARSMMRSVRPSDVQSWIAMEPPIVRSDDLRITWIGHATCLVQMDGVNILTDPLWTQPTRLFSRLLPPGIPFDQLPPIDCVILSHNHRDHMDEPTLTQLYKNHKPRFLVPYGDKAWFDCRGIKGVSEHMWWDTVVFGSLKLSFVPSHHWSQRGLFDHNKSLWGSWMVSGSNRVYFGGDTGYGEHFKQIYQEYGSPDVALLPIGPLEPRVMMQRSHIAGESVGRAYMDLQSRSLFPIHWGTFFLGDDEFITPVEALYHWWTTHARSEHYLYLPRVGKGYSTTMMSEESGVEILAQIRSSRVTKNNHDNIVF